MKKEVGVPVLICQIFIASSSCENCEALLEQSQPHVKLIGMSPFTK